MNDLDGTGDPLARVIVAARRSGTRAVRDAAPAPRDRLKAYATQQAVARALGARVGGWKVGMLADGTPTAAPMFAADMAASGARWTLPAEGSLVVEVEVALRLARDLPARPARPYARDEIAAAVDAVLVGVELLQSRFAGDGFPPFLLHVADNLGNAGYVAGDATREFAALDLARLRCRYTIDDTQRHDAVGGHPQDDPWTPVLASLMEDALPLGGYRAGQIVTTGTLVPPVTIDRPQRLRATLDGIGAVDVTFVR
jgi:2-keto-4-pentenoate hydratase